MDLVELADDLVYDKDAGILKIRVPKHIATVKLCGCMNFEIDDTMNFVMPTEEQRKNLKEMFCIEVIPAED